MEEERPQPRITPARLKLLQEMPVFGGVRTDTLEFMLRQAPVVHLRKGEFFFLEGDEGDCAFLLEQGRAMFWKDFEGSRYPMRMLDQGECFGEMAMIGLYPRSGSTQAIDDCQAIKITYEMLYGILRQEPEQCIVILMNMARDLSRRLRDADNLLLREWAKSTAARPLERQVANRRWMPI